MLISNLVGVRYSDELRKAIACLIEEHELRPGDPLPSIRRMAAELGLSPGTVASAYRQLAADGLVTSSQGRKSIVADPRAAEMPYDWPVSAGLVDLSGVYPAVEHIPDISNFFRNKTYSSGEINSNELVDKLAIVAKEWFYCDGLKSFDLTAHHGTLEAIERFLGIHVAPGKSVAVEDPGLPAITSLIRNMRLDPVPLQMDCQGVTPQALECAIVDYRASAVVLTPRAQNPTGYARNAERASQLRNVLEKYPDVSLVENDHFSLLSGCEFFSCHTESNPWMITRSLSKLLGSDVRLTLCASDNATHMKLRQRQLLSSGWVSRFLQAVSADALSDPCILQQLKSSQSVYSQRRLLVTDCLQNEHDLYVRGSSGLTMIVSVTDEGRAKSRMEYLGWAVQSGTQYRIDHEPFIRFSVSNLVDKLVPQFCLDLKEAIDGGSLRSRSGQIVC